MKSQSASYKEAPAQVIADEENLNGTNQFVIDVVDDDDKFLNIDLKYQSSAGANSTLTNDNHSIFRSSDGDTLKYDAKFTPINNDNGDITHVLATTDRSNQRSKRLLLVGTIIVILILFVIFVFIASALNNNIPTLPTSPPNTDNLNNDRKWSSAPTSLATESYEVSKWLSSSSPTLMPSTSLEPT